MKKKIMVLYKCPYLQSSSQASVKQMEPNWFSQFKFKWIVGKYPLHPELFLNFQMIQWISVQMIQTELQIVLLIHMIFQ